MTKVEAFKNKMELLLPRCSVRIEPFKAGSYPVTVSHKEYQAKVLVAPNAFKEAVFIARLIEKRLEYV